VNKHNSWERILTALSEPMTYHRLATFVHLHPRTVARILRDMEQEKFVHIARWEHCSVQGPMAAVYKKGNGQSVPRPRAMTSAEKARKSRANMDPRKKESVMARWRRVKPDFAASWLFGER